MAMSHSLICGFALFSLSQQRIREEPPFMSMTHFSFYWGLEAQVPLSHAQLLVPG